MGQGATGAALAVRPEGWRRIAPAAARTAPEAYLTRAVGLLAMGERRQPLLRAARLALAADAEPQLASDVLRGLAGLGAGIDLMRAYVALQVAPAAAILPTLTTFASALARLLAETRLSPPYVALSVGSAPDVGLARSAAELLLVAIEGGCLRATLAPWPGDGLLLATIAVDWSDDAPAQALAGEAGRLEAYGARVLLRQRKQDPAAEVLLIARGTSEEDGNGEGA